MFSTTDESELFTPWSLIHFISGAFAVVVSRKLGLTFNRGLMWYTILSVIYEIKDLLFTGAYLKNSIGDIISGTLGFVLMYNQSIQTILGVSIAMFILLISPLSGTRWISPLKIWTERK